MDMTLSNSLDGAPATFTRKNLPADQAHLVDDALEAFHAKRQIVDVIAVTGSNGE